MSAAQDEIVIRPARGGDTEAIITLTGREFGKASIDARIEEMFGGTPWLRVKEEAIRHELAKNSEGCFVAVYGGKLVGYVTTTINTVAARGVIANIAVSSDVQGKGLGRKLLTRALDYFKSIGLRQAKIETLATNEIGAHLYTSLGFKEVVRQIHFCMPLG